jgi:hypothetical protein
MKRIKIMDEILLENEQVHTLQKEFLYGIFMGES